MAKLEQGILGGGAGAVGTVVMGTWKGISTIRARVAPSNPRTARQVNAREKMRLLSQMGSSFLPFIRAYWNAYGDGTTGFNEFCKANYNAMQDGAPDGTYPFLPERLIATRGPLQGLDITGIEDAGGAHAGKIRLTVANAEGINGAADDMLAVVVARADTGALVYKMGFGDLGVGRVDALAQGVRLIDPGLPAGVTYANRSEYVFVVICGRATDARYLSWSSTAYDDGAELRTQTSAEARTRSSGLGSSGQTNPPSGDPPPLA